MWFCQSHYVFNDTDKQSIMQRATFLTFDSISSILTFRWILSCICYGKGQSLNPVNRMFVFQSSQLQNLQQDNMAGWILMWYFICQKPSVLIVKPHNIVPTIFQNKLVHNVNKCIVVENYCRLSIRFWFSQSHTLSSCCILDSKFYLLTLITQYDLI